MNAPFGGALDSPASHHRTSMLTSENKLRRAATSALTLMTFSFINRVGAGLRPTHGMKFIATVH